MKKVLCVILALVMLLSLCACDSKDYETALSMYEEGNYAGAREMFVALGDYEDSAAMVTKCDYQMAISLLESGDYEGAISSFEALGGYEDSAEYILTAKWGMLIEYIEENGDYNSDIGYTVLSREMAEPEVYYVSMYAENSETIVLYSHYVDENDSVVLTRDLTLPVRMGTGETEWIGLFDMRMNFYGMKIGYKEDGGGKIDIAVCSVNEELSLDTYARENDTIQGEVVRSTDKSEETMSTSMSKAWREMMEIIPELLAESGLPVTMADLGFGAIG